VNALRPTIGDTVLEQFTRDWEELALELHQLEMQKRRASAGLKDFVVMRRVESRVQKLSTVFERQRTLFDMFFSSGWETHPDATRLRKAMMEISVTIGSILRMGHPDRGRGSLAKAISDVEKAQKNVELNAEGERRSEGASDFAATRSASDLGEPDPCGRDRARHPAAVRRSSREGQVSRIRGVVRWSLPA
jgi:hypothetical protein